jgi:hypothetical protein
MNKTYRAIKEKNALPNMRQEIEGYVKWCKSCQVNKILRKRGKVPMEITTTTHQPRYTPFELVYGFKSKLPSNLRRDPNPQYNYYFLMELKSRLQTAQQTARERLITARHKSKEYYDKQKGGTLNSSR